MRHFIQLIVFLFFFSTSSFGQIKFNEIIVDDDYGGARTVSVADLDGDGLNDLICFSGSRAPLWYKNLGSLEFEERKITESLFLSIQEEGLKTTDLDQDGDIDIVALARQADDIYWFENDGQGNFEKHLIDENTLDAPWSVYVVDLNNDSFLDIISLGNFSRDLYAFINDGNQNFTPQLIDDDMGGAETVQAVDMDNDGDQDLVAGLHWYEQLNASFFTRHDIDENFAMNNIFVFDPDGDGDIDIVGGSASQMAVQTYINDGDQNFSGQVIQSDIYGAGVVFATDIDQDEKIDFLALAWQEEEFYWWENDGNAGFEPRLIDDSYKGATDIFPADLDNDGDIDLLTCNLGDDSVSIWVQERTPTNINAVELDNSILIFPNPVQDVINFKDQNFNSISYTIYNLAGKEIKHGTLNGSKISVSELIAGRYLIRMSDGRVASFGKVD